MFLSWIKKLKKDLEKAPARLTNRYKRYLRWTIRLSIGLIILEVGYIWGLMPDWSQFTHGPIQKSRMMIEYEFQKTKHNDWPNIQWHRVPLKRIPDKLTRAVVVAEDSRFYQHKGFDQQAIKNALEYNLAKGKFVYGASTISQQTIKNLFLNTSKNPLRKLHETILTFAMEQNVGKQRILEMYLNIAEFGRGIYGVGAAARYYFGVSVTQLSRDDAIELAATLPSPVLHNPKTRSDAFIQRRDKIRSHLGFPI